MSSEIIKDIFLYWSRHPELRIGQIVVSAAYTGGWKNDDVFYCPDGTLLDGLEKLLQEK